MWQCPVLRATFSPEDTVDSSLVHPRRRSSMSGRRRGRKARKTRRGDRSGKVTDVKIERSPKGTGRPVKVRIVRRRNGDVTEETYEL